ncbi:MAG: hypothetical protein KF735_01965 [Chelatococcus sp.]|jgi:hypothetical protein|uniref:hypothetical protein n=1 Tax=unclassified Chelatococcus TaxID=2638111 RepID=UPI001BCE8B10|nr:MULTISPECIES: hypothetical protein [unclassified Chelatococcus]CAH1665269.1 conserved hypothetical protein [Hyphomicrobiales bacterium]MBS7737695.1 hypothetical protein [Chelatococcus sp. HY11]MBX3536378.1 hypothetical protein [Chelatococcus sp.]MBX3544171.1 hypothetical protein [Chelatococcus sp.]MCO5079507.1 hypothetical protein [Chelatococcus sp.]
MRLSDPIRMSDIRKSGNAVSSMSRVEVARQFKMSLMLVVVLTVATIAVTAINHIASTNTVRAPEGAVTRVS